MKRCGQMKALLTLRVVSAIRTTHVDIVELCVAV